MSNMAEDPKSAPAVVTTSSDAAPAAPETVAKAPATPAEALANRWGGKRS